MNTLISKLRDISSEDIEWQIYFYTKANRKGNLNPYTAYSWSASDKKLIPSLVKSVVDYSTEDLTKNDYTLQDYTPNNNKNTIDMTSTDSLLISGNYEHLLTALSQAKPYDRGVKRPKGYVLVGRKNDDNDECYILIGIGSPIKIYKHAFFNQSVMQETTPDIIAIKPYWDVFISNTDCYMNGIYAHSFFNLQSFHVHNMGDVNKLLEKSGLIDNIPPSYPKTGKSIFTDILNANEDIEKSIRHLMNCAGKYPDDEYYGKLKIQNGKLDLSDMECYLSLMDLLACRYSNEGSIRGEIRPINVSFSPQ